MGRASRELTEGIADRDPVLLRPQLHPAPGPRRPTCSAPPTHGERFACAIARPPVYGVQFHPEKSSAAGLPLLAQLRRHLRRRVPASPLILYPAIDIRDGHAVRLVQGDYDRETAFDADPLDAARRWVEQGARALHVVDLDGARAGAPVNIEHVARICDAIEVPVQVGGGLREAGDVEAVLAAGAARAILGTAALSRPGAGRVAGGRARRADRGLGRRPRRRGRGRGLGAGAPSSTLGRRDRRSGRAAACARFVFTPVEVDGTLEGPGLDAARRRRRGRGRRRRGADLLGRHRHPRPPAGARRARLCPRSPGRSSAGRSTRAGSRSARAGGAGRAAELDPVLDQLEAEIRIRAVPRRRASRGARRSGERARCRPA